MFSLEPDLGRSPRRRSLDYLALAEPPGLPGLPLLPQRDPHPRRGRGGCDVLIAEADSHCARAFQHSLRLAGFTVVMARNSREVLSVSQAARPGLVLLDWGMPELDGPVCTRLLKRAHASRNLLVIAMSASGLPCDRSIALRAGCDGFLTKPVSFARLLTEIRRALGLGRTGTPYLLAAPRQELPAAGLDRAAE